MIIKTILLSLFLLTGCYQGDLDRKSLEIGGQIGFWCATVSLNKWRGQINHSDIDYVSKRIHEDVNECIGNLVLEEFK